MKLAVVPVDEDVHSVETLDFDNKTVDFRSVNACKLTKEQVEVMVNSFISNQVMRGGYRQSMEAALESIGIDVE